MSTPKPLAVQVSPLSLAMIGVRAAALALNISGNSQAAFALYTLADAAEAGKNVEAHMARVAEKLKSRASQRSDWEEVANAIKEDTTLLDAPG